jgi:molybdopterin converting factor subunit 1
VTIHVRLFAVLREKAGTSEFPLQLPEGSTVADAQGPLLERAPALREHIGRVAYAVNRSYVKPETRLNDGDELALIPPVSGG